ncbi:MAG: hypothetical protein ABIJ09_02405 [Pseudomonadota bacterium]
MGKRVWVVAIPIWATATALVIADSEEEAIAQFEMPSICHQCSDHIELGDFDVLKAEAHEDRDADWTEALNADDFDDDDDDFDDDDDE